MSAAASSSGIQLGFVDQLFENGALPTVRDSRLQTRYEGEYTVHGNQRWARVEHVGSGSFGEVWREELIDGDASNDGERLRVRAVKEIMLPRRRRDVDGMRRYARELEALVEFSRPMYLEYFVHAFGWFESSPGSFGIKIAMEYIPGGDLQVFVSQTRILSGTEAPKVIRQILKGLRLMHDSGFTHRDLKPENILIREGAPEWHVKIADFGITKKMQDLPSTTEIRGTFRYMPPELIRSRPALRYTPGDTREQKAADIWAVGEISAFLLTGETVYGRFVEDLGYESRLRAPFPSNDLEGVNAAAKEFIKQLLNIDFLRRPFAQQALSDIWLAEPAPVQRGPQRRSSPSGDERPHASASSSNTSNSVHSWPSTPDQSPRHSWDVRNRWSSSNPFRSFGGMLSPINEPRAEATAVTDTPGARSRRSLFPSRRSLYAESNVPIAIHSSRSRARTTPDPQIVRLRQVEVDGAARTAPGSVDVGTETERRLASPEVSGQRLPAANKSSRSQFATNKKAMSLLGSMHAGSEGNIYQELNVTALSGIKEPLSWQTMANLDTDPIFAPAGNAVAYRVEDQYCVLDTQTGKSIACGVPIAFANTSRLLAIELDHHGPLIQSFPDGVWRTRLQIPRSSMSREIESENRLILGHFSPSDSYVARLYDSMESLVVWNAVDGSIVNQIKCSVGPVVWKFHPLGGELLLCSPDHFSQNPEDRSTDNNVLFLSWYHAIGMSYARSQAFRYDGSNVQYRPIVALSEDCNTLGVAYGLRGTSRIKVFNMQGQILCDLPGDGKLLAIEPCPSGTLRLLYDSAESYAFDSRTRKFIKMKDKTWFYHDSAGLCGLSDADGMKLRVRHNAAKKTMDLPFFENVSWLHRKKMLTKACGVVAWSRDGSTVAVRYQKSDKNQTVGEADSTVVEIWSLKSILAPA